MSERLVQRFIDGLHHLEQTGDPEPLVATYAEEAETSNVASERVFRGRDGAHEFWRRYRGTFDETTSTFRNVIVAGDRAALEWETEGTGPTGDPFRYDGVSLLEMAGEEEGAAVTRFRAFFDPGHLGRQIAPDAKAPTARES